MESAGLEIRQQSKLLKKTLLINVIQNDITRLENQVKNISNQIVKMEKILSRRKEKAFEIDDPTCCTQMEQLVTNMAYKIQGKTTKLKVVKKQ